MNDYSEIPTGSTTKNDLGVDREDAVERLNALKQFIGYDKDSEIVKATQKSLDMAIKALEQEPKTGYWISTETKGVRYAFWCRYKCSLCGGLSDRTNFCPNCGAKMVEPQESEDTETWNGIHAQITAPKGTFERIFNDADDDNDI